MKNEEKDLLLQDLCARLPYGVKVYNEPYTSDLDNFEFSSTISETIIEIIKEGWKPYLRPMSSMTEEEYGEFLNTQSMECGASSHPKYEYTYKTFDWLNKKMFDYRGLISMDLALPASNCIYDIK